MGPCTGGEQRRPDHGAVKASGTAQPAAPCWAPCSPALSWNELGGLGSGFEALLQKSSLWRGISTPPLTHSAGTAVVSGGGFEKAECW